MCSGALCVPVYVCVCLHYVMCYIHCNTSHTLIICGSISNEVLATRLRSNLRMGHGKDEREEREASRREEGGNQDKECR